MAGREDVGYEAADADLFVDRPWVIVPGALAGESDIERVTDLAVACRAVVVPMDAAVHDRAVAAVSHLPLIVSAALVEAVAIRPGDAASRAAARAEWPVASGLAAGGWRDMSRLARGDPAMGAAIAVTNATELGARLRDLRGVLDAWQAELDRPDGPDEKGATARLTAAKAILEKSKK
jgi:prephenate dehydrogenase